MQKGKRMEYKLSVRKIRLDDMNMDKLKNEISEYLKKIQYGITKKRIKKK